MLRINYKGHHIGYILFDVWIICFTTLVVTSFFALQHSRIESCKRTYQSFSTILDPFIPNNPNTFQKKQADQFHMLIQEKVDSCSAQVNLWKFWDTNN